MIVVSKNKPKGIIWIASYPRSGNTWTRAFINTLVHMMRDPNFADVDINSIEEGSASESKAEHYTQLLGKPAHRATDAEIASVRPRVQAEIVTALGRPVFIKTHNANAVDHGFPIINMGVSAGAVYVVRNPLDVAISFAALQRHHHRPGDRRHGDTRLRRRAPAATMCGSITGSWTENVRSWTARPHPAVLVVRYEDMIAKPHGIFRRRRAPSPDVSRPRSSSTKAIELTGFERLRDKEAAPASPRRPDTDKPVLPRR